MVIYFALILFLLGLIAGVAERWVILDFEFFKSK